LELSRREGCWKSDGSNEKMATEKGSSKGTTIEKSLLTLPWLRNINCQSAFIKKLSTIIAELFSFVLTLRV
jgi:hypothetical protein